MMAMFLISIKMMQADSCWLPAISQTANSQRLKALFECAKVRQIGRVKE
jgi:hypothetical protein